MTPDRWETIGKIFNEATALRPEQRQSFVEEACGGDAGLIAEVQSLLDAHAEAGDFIDEPIVENIAAEISEMPTLTGKFIGHYQIEKSIGRGGMGDVYLAKDTRLDRLVALKKLPERLAADPLFVKRFRTEAKAAATIHHPNVATIFTVEEVDDRPYIAMEYVEGRTLDAVTPPEGMDVARFLDIFVQVTEALSHAHEKGVTHRDIKPGNIMIASDGRPKILDFGLAQIAEDQQNSGVREATLTRPGQILGTPSYMSPEQAQGKDVDHLSDIFSLGVVMYEALTGVRPFTGDSNAELISNLLKTDPPTPQVVRPAVPGLVSRLVARCMQKRPGDRPQSMQEVRSALGEARRMFRAGTSTGSFARRLYSESASVGVWLRVAPVIAVAALAVLAWYLFSGSNTAAPFSFDKITMRRLSDTNNVGYVQISPDGRSLAFATFETDGSRALWIRRIDDRNALQLVAPERQQYWGGLAISPDGGQVFYITADRVGTHGTMYRVPSLGGPSRKLVEFANDVGGVSPDGERILLVRYGSPSCLISVRTSDGSDEQVLMCGESVSPTFTNFRDPQFSSDGGTIYYIQLSQREGVEDWSVNELTLNDKSTRVIYRQPERISELAVLPRREGLLMTAVDPASNLQQVFYISADDGKKSRVTNDLFFYFGVNVDREAKSIVVSQRAEEQKVWIGEPNALSSLQPLNQEPNAHGNVAWTPDGRIVYDGYENNVSHIWVSDADGRNLQKLTTTETDDSQPNVTPDGRFIVYTSKRSGRAQLWRMGIDGSGQTLLTDTAGVSQAPRLTADGQFVYFEWIHDGHRSLGRVPTNGGAVEEIEKLDTIPINNAYYWAASPDGKYFAHSVWDAADNRIKVAIDSVETGQRVNVLNIWPSLVLKWTPDSKTIVYRERQTGYVPESEILKVDVTTGRVSQLISVAPEFIVDVSYSHDGGKIAIVRGRGSSNAVMLSPAPEK